MASGARSSPSGLIILRFHGVYCRTSRANPKISLVCFVLEYKGRENVLAAAPKPLKILVIDVGGTHVKVRVAGKRSERKIASGATMTAEKMVEEVKHAVADWQYDVI